MPSVITLSVGCAASPGARVATSASPAEHQLAALHGVALGLVAVGALVGGLVGALVAATAAGVVVATAGGGDQDEPEQQGDEAEPRLVALRVLQRCPPGGVGAGFGDPRAPTGDAGHTGRSGP